MKRIVIIGGGPGDEAYILPAACQTIEECRWIAGDRRLLKSFSLEPDHERIHPMDRMAETLEWIGERPESDKVGLLVSGDPLMYSMFRLVERTFPEADVSMIPGIGSIQAFAAKLGETMEDSRIISAHGRDLTGRALAEAAETSPKLFILCDRTRTPAWIGRQLINFIPGDLEMAVGSWISYPEESIRRGRPELFLEEDFPALSLVMVKNSKAVSERSFRWLRDEEFFRNETPMTREEIRWIALGKLGLSANSVLWDIGAGTGSISIEAARSCRDGQIIAVEKNERALEVLRKNMEQLAPENMQIAEGNGAEVVRELPDPTHVFVGGAGGELKSILEEVCRRGSGILVMIACVTMETLTEAYDFCRNHPQLTEPRAITLRIEKSRPLGRYQVMDGSHPVTLIMTETAEKNRENRNDR